MLFWNIIPEGNKSLILSVFVALTLLSVFPATAPRGAFPDDRVIIILVEVGGDWLRHASCRNISHTHKHMPAWLTSQSQSGLIWLCVNVCVCSEQRWVYLFIFFPYGEFIQNVNVSFSLHAGVSRRRSRGVWYIYQVVFEHLKYTFPSEGLGLSSRSSRSHSQSSTQNMWLPTWHVVPRCATLWNCTSELTHKHRSVSVCANMSSLSVA